MFCSLPLTLALPLWCPPPVPAALMHCSWGCSMPPKGSPGASQLSVQAPCLQAREQPGLVLTPRTEDWTSAWNWLPPVLRVGPDLWWISQVCREAGPTCSWRPSLAAEDCPGARRPVLTGGALVHACRLCPAAPTLCRSRMLRLPVCIPSLGLLLLAPHLSVTDPAPGPSPCACPVL